MTLCQQLIFEDTIPADNKDEAMEITMERNSYDDLNWRRNGSTQIVCVEPAYDGSKPFETLISSIITLDDSQEWTDNEECAK